MKKCSGCKEEKMESAFHVDRSKGEGLQGYCKDCVAIYMRDYRRSRKTEIQEQGREYNQTPAGKERRKRGDKNYRKKFPEKIKAINVVNHAIREGKICRPLICKKCGEQGKVQAHHPDYSKPLEVKWLCVPCHVKKHADLVLTQEM